MQMRVLARRHDGASAAEHVIVIALVALAALGAYELLGTETEREVRCVASSVAGAAVRDCATGSASSHASRAALEARATGAARRDALRDEGGGAARDVPRMPEDDGGCGLNPLCHVDNAWDATAGVRHAGSHAASWSASVVERASMLAVPPLDPRRWPEAIELRAGFARGAVDWVAGTAEGLAGAAKWLVTDADPKEVAEHLTPSALYRMAKAIVIGVARDLDMFATGDPGEAGRAGAVVALDAASLFAGAGVATRGGRITELAARVRRADRPYDVRGHATAAGLVRDGTSVAASPEELARWILDRPDYVSGTPVRLVSCPAGQCFVRELSRRLDGAEVQGADVPIVATRGGRVFGLSRGAFRRADGSVAAPIAGGWWARPLAPILGVRGGGWARIVSDANEPFGPVVTIEHTLQDVAHRYASRYGRADNTLDLVVNNDGAGRFVAHAEGGSRTMLTPAELADELDSYGNTQGWHVRLITPSSGPEIEAAAQEIADRSGRTVMLPPGELVLDSNGSITYLTSRGRVPPGPHDPWLSFNPRRVYGRDDDLDDGAYDDLDDLDEHDAAGYDEAYADGEPETPVRDEPPTFDEAVASQLDDLDPAVRAVRDLHPQVAPANVESAVAEALRQSGLSPAKRGALVPVWGREGATRGRLAGFRARRWTSGYRLRDNDVVWWRSFDQRPEWGSIPLVEPRGRGRVPVALDRDVTVRTYARRDGVRSRSFFASDASAAVTAAIDDAFRASRLDRARGTRPFLADGEVVGQWSDDAMRGFRLEYDDVHARVEVHWWRVRKRNGTERGINRVSEVSERELRDTIDAMTEMYARTRAHD